MLIKFSILWVEDDDRWYESTYKALNRYLEDLGFHLIVKRISDPEKEDWEYHFENTSQYDLMLIDWRIHGADEVDKPIGGEVISKIREHIPYSDIIFYSGDSGLAEEVKSKELQGVYTSMRGDLREDAEDLIEHLLHKTLHPKIMRGIIVSSLSQIDEMCFKVIKHKFDTSPDQPGFAAKLKKSIRKQAERQLSDKAKSIELEDSEFIEKLHSTLILDSYKRACKVVELTKEELEPALSQTIEGFPFTVQKRNWLAHWKHLEDSDTQIVLAEAGKENYVFDQDEATQMRKSINQVGAILDQYLEANLEK